MTDADIGFLPAAALLGHYAGGTLSPVEVTRAVLRHVERLEPRLNAMARLTPEHALAAARESEARWQRGEARPLEGVPVTIKDLQHTKGVRTDFGTRIMEGTVPDVDAPCVARLHAAGCVMLGKTTSSSEWGWKGVSQAPVYGITSNPWREGYNAGASSAGAGAGAAAGYGPLHQGGDGAGSIRMPAHFSGTFGLKPTYGRVPSWPMSNNDNATHMGPITRTVRDAALMLGAMAGPHPWDCTSLEAPSADYAALLGADPAAAMRGLRVAFSPDLGHARVDPEVAALAARAVGAFEAMGAHVEQVAPAWGAQGPELARFFWPATFSARLKYLPEWEDRMDPGFVAMIRSVEGIEVRHFMALRERRFAYCQAIHEFMEGYDLLLTPAVSVAAFPAERLQPAHWPQHPWDWLSWAEFSYPFNWSGSPAASVPCGRTADGLPVGLQVVGRRFDDAGVLRACAAFEATCPWAGTRPPLVA